MDGQRNGAIAVVGQAARDLVLRTDGLPGAGGSARVAQRIERLGGKGANIAVGIHQLNPEVAPSLIAVLGDDHAGAEALGEAQASGLDVRHVARRGSTALLVDLVTAAGERRLLEDVPETSLLSVADVERASPALRSAGIVVLQLQQPADAVLRAAQIAAEAGARLVLDGAIGGAERDALLPLASVVRADAREASALAGVEIGGWDDAEAAAASLLDRGPEVVALGVDEGDLVAWPGGSRRFPHGDEPVLDPTGGGDAFVAGLVTGLRQGDDPVLLGQRATRAAGAAVRRLGGRPHLGAAG
ncbi:PfkB family carbohydrate kinase [Agrococcus sp. HG114]|uniref:PfkB family carbohydrate kinase n=1 Tax=Agrococcus sp. HG114 TaxID=2969757 RepID=UPI00215A9606|nr:PfkB family carbohydrate kinase [Agrococcus sp. HG114]MCR8671396.1 PfkB family carbohydrate kinase [Agrococcus sp. HG114]